MGVEWALAAALAGPAWGQEAPAGVRLLPPPAATPAAAEEEEGWTRRVAELYGVPVDLPRSLRALGLDRMDAELAVAVSTQAQRPVAEVLELRRAGMEWGEIARTYGFTLVEAVRDKPGDGTRRPPRRRASSPR